MFGKPGLETASDAIRLRHSADPGGMIHHTLALGKRELPEQEKSLARRGRNPVRIATARIEKGGLGRPGCRLRKIDEFILDLEGAQSFKLLQRQNVGHDVLLIFARFSQQIFATWRGIDERRLRS